MNLLDIGIVLLLVAAAAHGLSQGAALQVLSFGGLWAGFGFGAWIGPRLSPLASTQMGKAMVSVVSLFGGALLIAGIGRTLGVRAWSALKRLKLGVADSAVGAIIALVATLVAVWLFAITLSTGPSQEIANAIHSSAIVRGLVDRLPPAPAVFARIRALVDASGFPQVFTDLEPSPTAPVALPSDPAVRAAVQAAGQATVKIVGLGCGGVQEGSGFIAAPGHVVTNAHVIAGIDRPSVQDRRGARFNATPVFFDPKMDLAVLRVARLGTAPLPMLRNEVRRGDGTAVMGYPGGGPFQAGAAAVLREFQATGRDIYGRSLATRDVYQIQAQVRPGNSGGPFVRANGQVIGVVFAASTTDAGVGYALTSAQVAPRVDQATQSAQVDTGPCAA